MVSAYVNGDIIDNRLDYFQLGVDKADVVYIYLMFSLIYIGSTQSRGAQCLVDGDIPTVKLGIRQTEGDLNIPLRRKRVSNIHPRRKCHST